MINFNSEVLVSNFSDFSYSINEGNSYKKNLGIIGPSLDWGYKIRTCCPESGGNPNDQCLIVSGTEDESFPEITLKYIYGGDKESECLTIPKHAFSYTGTSQNPILQTRKNVRWWGDEENQESLDDFIDAFLESKHFESIPEEDISGDICSLMEILGIESPILEVIKKKDFYWIAKLEDGTEIEIKRKDNDNFLKALKVYLKGSYDPEVEINHQSPGYEAIFCTPKGKFYRGMKKITDIVSDPIHHYLLKSSMKKDPEIYHQPVIDYLQSVLKSKDWRPEATKNPEEIHSQDREINQLKKILMNTMREEELDEMYSRARESYSFSNKKETK